MFGILNIDKPPDVTSRDVVNVVQRLVKPVKVGHAGTLDPMATGVLLVCTGGATRLISLLQKSPKTYVAEFTLGQQSDTDDSTGVVEAVAEAVTPDESGVRAALKTFEGTIQQVPPAFSAVKVAGRRAYSLARRGEDVALSAKTVTVHDISVTHYQWPTLGLEIRCGSGTYIRSIGRDLGKLLGCGAVMSALRRTRIGNFAVEDAASPDAVSQEGLAELLHNPIQLAQELRRYVCSQDEVEQLRNGRSLNVAADRIREPRHCIDASAIALTSADETELLAIAEFIDECRLQPRQVFIR